MTTVVICFTIRSGNEIGLTLITVRISSAIWAEGLYKEPIIPDYEWAGFPHPFGVGIFLCAVEQTDSKRMAEFSKRMEQPNGLLFLCWGTGMPDKGWHKLS